MITLAVFSSAVLLYCNYLMGLDFQGEENCHEIGNFSGSFDVTNHCDVCLVLCCSGRAASKFKQALLSMVDDGIGIDECETYF